MPREDIIIFVEMLSILFILFFLECEYKVVAIRIYAYAYAYICFLLFFSFHLLQNTKFVDVDCHEFSMHLNYQYYTLLYDGNNK